MPAMTIILEWSGAEMGEGPPAAEVMGEVQIGQIFQLQLGGAQPVGNSYC